MHPVGTAIDCVADRFVLALFAGSKDATGVLTPLGRGVGGRVAPVERQRNESGGMLPLRLRRGCRRPQSTSPGNRSARL